MIVSWPGVRGPVRGKHEATPGAAYLWISRMEHGGARSRCRGETKLRVGPTTRSMIREEAHMLVLSRKNRECAVIGGMEGLAPLCKIAVLAIRMGSVRLPLCGPARGRLHSWRPGIAA